MSLKTAKKQARQSQFVCQECGFSNAKWLGKCPECQTWNSLVEEFTQSEPKQLKAVGLSSGQASKALPIDQVVLQDSERLPTGLSDFDRLLGGGIVLGSLVLLGGEPGIGKSTLLLQVAQSLALKGHKVLYVSGEESAHQVKARAERLGATSPNLLVLSEVNLQNIVSGIEQVKPEMIVIDSIQIIFREDVQSAPGSVAQVRECSATLMHLAKRSNVPIFVVGHVTKEGNLAGPKVLEHIVDTVIYFEGDRHHSYRIVRSVKNRFGSTNEICVFDMRDVGLKEVLNPSELFLSDEGQDNAGSVVVPSMEGTRPLLVEMQALVSSSHNFGNPRRVSTFIDHNRVAMLIAIFEKRLGVSLGNSDVFINLVGGMKIVEPAADLAVIVAMMSSLRNICLRSGTAVFGEVGLGGEVRSVAQAERRVSEAERLGFKRCILPLKAKQGLNSKGIELIGVSSIEDAIEEALEA